MEAINKARVSAPGIESPAAILAFHRKKRHGVCICVTGCADHWSVQCATVLRSFHPAATKEQFDMHLLMSKRNSWNDRELKYSKPS